MKVPYKVKQYTLSMNIPIFLNSDFCGQKRQPSKNKTRYQFVATRANKRRLAQIIKNREHDYVEIR